MMKKCDNRLPSCLTPEECKVPDVYVYPQTHLHTLALALSDTHIQSKTLIDPLTEGHNIHTASAGVSHETKSAGE